MQLDNIPEVNFCETDASQVVSEGLALYESITGRTLYPGDPERLFLMGLLTINAQQRQIIDQTGKQNLLRYASGNFLEHLGAMTETDRLPAARATTTVRFSMTDALAFAVTIPAGSRVTPDNQLMFATTAVAEIAIGQTYVEVAAECEVEGSAGNDFVAGQINRLVDPLAYIETVSNTTTSTGGADLESDDNYRERIQLSPERITTAGPTGSYEFWAKTAHQDIVAVAVYSSTAGQVDVRPLLKDGGLPDAEVLALVAAVLSDKTRRPLTDQVVVAAPDTVSYDVDVTYYISNSSSGMAVQIQAAAQQALGEYLTWQRSEMGRDINPSELVKRLVAAGVKRVEVVAPVFTVLDKWKVAQDNTISLTYGGLEDE